MYHILGQCVIPREWYNRVSIITPELDPSIKCVLLQLRPTVVKRVRGQRERRKVKYIETAIGPGVQIDNERIQIALKNRPSQLLVMFLTLVLPWE